MRVSPGIGSRRSPDKAPERAPTASSVGRPRPWAPVRGVPVHFGVAAGFGSLLAGSFFEDACDCNGVSGAYNEAGPGFVFAPHAGIDWSVGDSWTMGPLFRLWLGPTNRFGSGFVVAPELAFSAARF
jgi:hypothetical protein